MIKQLLNKLYSAFISWSALPIWKREDTCTILGYTLQFLYIVLILSSIVLSIAFTWESLFTQIPLIVGGISLILWVLLQVWKDILIWYPENRWEIYEDEKD